MGQQFAALPGVCWVPGAGAGCHARRSCQMCLPNVGVGARAGCQGQVRALCGSPARGPARCVLGARCGCWVPRASAGRHVQLQDVSAKCGCGCQVSGASFVWINCLKPCSCRLCDADAVDKCQVHALCGSTAGSLRLPRACQQAGQQWQGAAQPGAAQASSKSAMAASSRIGA